MDIKKFLVTESERKDILLQYGLIKEQDVVKKSLELDKKVDFPGGYYNQKYLEPILQPEIEKIKTYLSNGAGKKFLVTVDITSSESRIPNTDNEAGGKRVESGYLSQKRNETIQKYITEQLQSFVDDKLLASLPSFKVTKPEIKGPEWRGQPFCPINMIPKNDNQGYECLSPKFNAGRNTNGKPITNWVNGRGKKATDGTYAGGLYSDIANEFVAAQSITVKMILKELPDISKCLNNMIIEVNYTNLTEKHKCNNATYNIYMTAGSATAPTNSDLLFRTDGKNYASLDNNNSSYDNNPNTCVNANSEKCKRYNKFIISPEIAERILKQEIDSGKETEKPTFKIWARCIGTTTPHPEWGTGCHKSKKDPNFGVGDVKIISGTKNVSTFEVKTPSKKEEIKLLQTISACGTAQ